MGVVDIFGRVPAYIDAAIATDLCVVTIGLKARLNASTVVSRIFQQDYRLVMSVVETGCSVGIS